MSGESRAAKVALALALVAVCAAILLYLVGTRNEIRAEESTWPDSAEFSHLMTGQTRFSTHESGEKNILVLVDHSTGVQYLVTATGACPLLDVDGSPLRVLEAGDDGE